MVPSLPPTPLLARWTSVNYLPGSQATSQQTVACFSQPQTPPFPVCSLPPRLDEAHTEASMLGLQGTERVWASQGGIVNKAQRRYHCCPSAVCRTPLWVPWPAPPLTSYSYRREACRPFPVYSWPDAHFRSDVCFEMEIRERVFRRH